MSIREPNTIISRPAASERCVVAIKIDPEFRDLIPVLAPEERGFLKASLIAEGRCRDAIVIWGDLIVDGHNRYELCLEHNLDFRVSSVSFPDRDAAKEWILRNQLGRRNLSDYQRGVIAIKLKPFLEAKGKERMSEGGKKEGLANWPNLESPTQKPFSARREMSQASGVSERTLARIEQVEKEASPELKSQLSDRKVSIDAAAKVATLPKPEQARIVAEGPKAVVAKAAEIRHGTKINGVMAPDPPDVAKGRAAGKIPENAVVEVTEPEQAEISG